MYSTRKDAINVGQMEEGAVSGTFEALKKMATIIACLCISGNLYAQAIPWSAIPVATKLDLTGPSDPIVLTAPNTEASVPLSITGDWQYQWSNPSGQTQTVTLDATYTIGGVPIATTVVTTATATIPSNPNDSILNLHQSPSLPFQGSVSLGPLPVGDYTATVTIGGKTDSVAVSIVPEPETYAMMLAGLGVLGWRLRHSRS